MAQGRQSGFPQMGPEGGPGESLAHLPVGEGAAQRQFQGAAPGQVVLPEDPGRQRPADPDLDQDQDAQRVRIGLTGRPGEEDGEQEGAAREREEPGGCAPTGLRPGQFLAGIASIGQLQGPPAEGGEDRFGSAASRPSLLAGVEGHARVVVPPLGEVQEGKDEQRQGCCGDHCVGEQADAAKYHERQLQGLLSGIEDRLVRDGDRFGPGTGIPPLRSVLPAPGAFHGLRPQNAEGWNGEQWNDPDQFHTKREAGECQEQDGHVEAAPEHRFHAGHRGDVRIVGIFPPAGVPLVVQL